MRVKLAKRNQFGSKARLAKAEVGKWYAFTTLRVQPTTGYGKVVAILDDEYVEVEKWFELPDYRPYACHKWFDDLPFAI